MLSRLIAVLMCAASLPAADISSSGDWFENITAADLVSGAGSNLRNPLDSAAGTTVLSITGVGAWSLKARASGTLPSGVTVWARRASGGTGSGSISGGEAYVQLSGTDAEFFTGSEDRGNISIQFRITGLNCSITPGNYSSPITFTIQ